MKNNNPDYFRADTPDELFEEFRKASEQVCSFLKIKTNKIEFLRYETKGKGLDYIASCNYDSKGFVFHITTFTKDENVVKGELTADLEIYNSDGIAPFVRHEPIRGFRNSPNFLQRWIASVISQYAKEVLSDELKRLFYDADIRVYGIPEYPTPTSYELMIFLKGVISCIDKLTICKFKHVRRIDNYRQFSYAFLASKGITPLWIFFLKVGSPDSGGAKISLDEIESLIDEAKTKIHVKVDEFDVDYDRLVSYLLSNSRFFEKEFISELYEKSIFRDFHYLAESDVFGQDFSESFKKMEKYYESGDFRSALHEIRPLVQHALKITCDKRNVDLSTISRLTISTLTGRLISEKILSGSLQKWAEAFSHEPNESLHSIYPTEDDLFDPIVRSRIILSFQVGLNIIQSLHEVLGSDKEDNGEDESDEY